MFSPQCPQGLLELCPAGEARDSTGPFVPWAELQSRGRGGAQQPWLQAGDGLIPWRREGLLLATLLGGTATQVPVTQAAGSSHSFQLFLPPSSENSACQCLENYVLSLFLQLEELNDTELFI